jgi:hypothetical protein
VGKQRVGRLTLRHVVNIGIKVTYNNDGWLYHYNGVELKSER